MISKLLKRTACLCLALIMILPVSVITLVSAADEQPEYYINEDFDRFELGAKLPGNTTGDGLAPWQYCSQEYGYQSPPTVIDMGGEKAAYYKVYRKEGGTSLYAWGYNSKYLPVAYGGSAKTGTDDPFDMSKYVRPAYTEHELDFSFKLSHMVEEGAVVENAFLGIYSSVLAIKVGADGNSYLNVSTGNAGVINYAGITDKNYVPVCKLEPETRTNIRFIAYRVDPSSNRTRKLIRLWVNGEEVTKIVDVMGNLATPTTYKDFPTEGLLLTNNGQNKMDYNTSHNYTRMFLGGTNNGGSAEMWLYGVKYAPFNPVKTIEVDKPEYLVGVNKEIKLNFTLKPTDPENISSYVTITDENSTPFTDWSGNYDPTTNSYTITPNSYLAYNTDYTVSVSETMGYDLMLDGITAKTKTFTTGFAKVTAELTTEKLDAGEQRIYAKVKNDTLSSGTFKTLSVLLKDNAGMLNVIDTVETTHALAVSEEKTVEAAKFNIEDAEKSFVKVFFLEDGDAIADSLTIGDEKEAVSDEVTAGENPVTLTISTTPDNGRIEIDGKFAGKTHRAIFVTVKDPNGKLMYANQASSAENGDFAFDFNLPALSLAGNYSIDVKASGAANHNETFNMDFSSVKPVASNLAIVGDPICGKELTAKYDYFHFAGNADESDITWLADIGEGGAFEAVGTGKTFTIPDELLEKNLKFSVLAKSAGGGVADSAVETETVEATAIPKISNIYFEQDDNTVSVEYDYSHALGYEQKGSEYRWFMSDSENGKYEEFENDESFYEVTKADDGNYVKVIITPKANVPEDLVLEKTGDPTESEPFYIEYYAPKSSSGGGGGGGGSSRGTLVVNTPTAVIAEDAAKPGEIDFADVRGHWAEEAIFRLYDSGIVTGKSETTFEPDTKVSRAEFIAILVRSLRFENAKYAGVFSDVKEGDWYADVLQAAYDNQILFGSEGMANPNAQITREEMAALAIRGYEALHGKAELSGSLLSFGDAEMVSDWAVTSVSKAKELGLISGVGDGLFAPKATTTRAESCVIIGRILDKTDFEALAEAKKAEEEAQNAENAENTESAETEKKESNIDIETGEAVDEQVNLNTDDNPLDQFHSDEYATTTKED